MPAPQSPAAVPACAQVSVPLGTTFQPFALSTLSAVDTLNGYGFVVALEGRNGVCG